MTSDKKWAISTSTFTNRTRNQIHESFHNYSIKLRTNAGKVVAEYSPHYREIKKTVNEEDHMLRTPPAWSYDTSVINKVIEYERKNDNPAMNDVWFVIKTTDTKKTYEVSWKVFIENSFRHNRAGPQLALTLNHWRVIGEDFEQLGFDLDV